VKELAQLERAAVAAHQADTPWGQFWPTVAADVAAIGDYAIRGELIHKLVGLVAAGNADGERPAGDWLTHPRAPTALFRPKGSNH